MQKRLSLCLTAAIAVSAIAAAGARADTFTVTTTADSDDGACTVSLCSLRDAVIASNAATTTSGNTITLSPGDYKLTIGGQNMDAHHGDLNVTQSVTVDGAGASSTTIDGNGIDRIFDVACQPLPPCPDTTSLTVNGVTLTGGAPGPRTGGTNVLGGAILMETAGTVSVQNSTLTNNVAQGGTQGYGGAIYAFTGGATIGIANSTFSANKALGDGLPGANHGGGFGGAIYTGVLAENGVIGMHVSVTNSQFDGNRAGGGGLGNYGSGGAIMQQAGATGDVGSLTVTGSSFDHNSAGGGGGSAYGEGGAIYTEDPGATLTDTTFTSNAAGGGGASADGEGGALYTETGAVGMSGSQFSANLAGGGGGDANGEGGALYTEDGGVTVNSSQFTANVAGGGGGNADGEGGALRSEVATMTISTSTISGNTAGGSNGSSTGASGEGGGIYTAGSGNLSVTDSTVSGNVAGGGDPNAGGQGGAIYTGDSPGDVTNTVLRSTIANNQSGGRNAYGEGGGIFAGGVFVTNSTLTGNSAGGGGESGDGGAIDAVMTIDASTIAGNTVAVGAGTAGGGGVDGDLIARNTIIADNLKGTATNNCSGGAVASHGNDLENGTTCTFTGAADINAEPDLGPLAANGGPTQTLALLPGSPAIGKGNAASCSFTGTDQRGVSRSGHCDIGAYAYSPPGGSTASPQWSCSHAGHVTLSVTAAPGGAAPAAIHYRLDGGADHRVATSGNPATTTLAVSAGPHVLEYWGESAGGALEATHHTVALHCVGPAISKLKVKPKSFHARTAGPTICATSHTKGHKPPHCATISYNDALAALTTFTIARLSHGHLIRLRGKFTHHDKTGKNSLQFSGRLNGHKLAPGSYKLSATPDAGGVKGPTVSAPFKVLS